MSTDVRDPETYAIIGAAMEVHRELGRGFLEAVYQESLAIELSLRGVPFQREISLGLRYKGHEQCTAYRADFVCFGVVTVELKAITALTAIEEAQLINYLRATRLEKGLLLNFARSSLEYKRFVLTDQNNLRPSAKSAVSSLG